MVKIIVSISVILLFAGSLIAYDWPSDAAGIIRTIALIIFSAAAGIAALNIERGVRGGE